MIHNKSAQLVLKRREGGGRYSVLRLRAGVNLSCDAHGVDTILAAGTEAGCRARAGA